MDRGVVALLGRTVGLLVCLWSKAVSTATFPLFLAKNDGKVAVLIVWVWQRDTIPIYQPCRPTSAHFTTGFFRCAPATGRPVLTSLVTINLTAVVVGYVFDSKAASAAAVAP